MTTLCECVLAGYCQRHKVKKDAHRVKLCQRKQSYFRAWEEGRGLGQNRVKVGPQLGPIYNHWAPLHAYPVTHWHDWDANKAQKWYRIWKRAIPKTGCGCAENWKKEVAKYPPNFTSAEAFFQWAWLVHDAVNERLGKLRVSLAECYGIWMQGSSRGV